ncbi:hypothetical protein BVRB_040080 [Beta vulgaris subsp. vulgaris]|uniref:Uncharacterized protein n=1 Tax=Beta vulgaris subsp. vulgaris TaxID=3555 RepID=A0A0J7YN76_BETVV|nr:hypothetical protein BVRB_040080 [Beta vulgaris subsp. vulgaris]
MTQTRFSDENTPKELENISASASNAAGLSEPRALSVLSASTAFCQAPISKFRSTIPPSCSAKSATSGCATTGISGNGSGSAAGLFYDETELSNIERPASRPQHRSLVHPV